MLLVALTLFPSCRPDDFLHYDRNPPVPEDRSVQVRQFFKQDGLDILWVIDNSGSMRQAQEGVIQNAITFFGEFSQRAVDWKMGLISTDTRNAPFIGFTPQTLLTDQTPDGLGLFQAALRRLTTNGDSTERSYIPILSNLTEYDFLRPDSVLALIIVTDAPEQSGISTQAFLRIMETLKPREKITVFGIFAPDDWNCDSDGGWNYRGSRYEELVTALDGKTYPMCEGDFQPMLRDIARRLSSRVVSPWIYLETRPEPSTIRIRHRGIEIPGGPRSRGGFWHYNPNQNAIVFHDMSFAPNDDEVVDISFEPAGRVRE